ncbi:hypothetical protein C789_4173 [Microcystis aeruginosa FACHB-905 = DIANCHI905]|nr:hypothetical protein C789_4173 [Microcystis aeruginosa FACHB-905 = DIANCHI905]
MPLGWRNNIKSVEYRLYIRTAERQKAKGGINNQFLITGFSITQNLKLITDHCYLSSHSALNLIPKPS